MIGSMASGSAFIYQIKKMSIKIYGLVQKIMGRFKFSNGFFKNYSVKQGLLNNKVAALLPNDGSVWFGTDKGNFYF
jgi:hypothetical protein